MSTSVVVGGGRRGLSTYPPVVVYRLPVVWILDAIDKGGLGKEMETLPLSAEVAGKVIAFERIVADALVDDRIDHNEGLRIIAASRATNRDTLLMAEGMDFIGTVARGTAALDSPRVQRKINERRRRGAMVTLESHHPESEPTHVRAA